MKPEDMDREYRIGQKRRSMSALGPGDEVSEQLWKRHSSHGRHRVAAEARACATTKGPSDDGSGTLSSSACTSRLLPTFGLATTRVDATGAARGHDRYPHKASRERRKSRRQNEKVPELMPGDAALQSHFDGHSDASLSNAETNMGIMVPHSPSAGRVYESASHVEEVPSGAELWLSRGMSSQELALVPSDPVWNSTEAQAHPHTALDGQVGGLEDETIKKDYTLSLQLAEYASTCGDSDQNSILDQPELWVGLLHDEVIGPELCTVLKKEIRHIVTTRGSLASGNDQSKNQACQASEDIHATPPDKVISGRHDQKDQLNMVEQTPAPLCDKWRFERVDLSQKFAQDQPEEKACRLDDMGKVDLACDPDTCLKNTASLDEDWEDEGEDQDDDATASAAAFVPAFAKVMEHLHLREKVGLATLCQASLEVVSDVAVWDSVLINIMDLSQLDSALSGLGSCGNADGLPRCRRDANGSDASGALAGLLRVTHLRVDLSPRIPGAWTSGRSADPLGLLCQRVLPKFTNIECLEMSNVEDVSMDFRFLNIRSTALREFREVLLSPSCGIFGDGTRMYSLVASKFAEKTDVNFLGVAGCAEKMFMQEHKAVVRNGGDNFHIAHAPWRCFQGHQVRSAYEAILAGLGV